MSTYDDFGELEHQVEKGNLFAHTVLTEQIMGNNENESLFSSNSK